MRKLFLALTALACLIGPAAAQQAPTSTADQGKPGAAPWPVTWTGQSVLADLRVAGAPVAAGNPVPVSVTNLPATQTVAGTVTANIGTTNGLALDASVQAVKTALGSPFQAGGSIANTAFGISGTLPAFAAAPTFNLGTLNGAATAANQSSEIAALGGTGDAAYAGSGSSSIIAALKGLYVALMAPTPAGSNIIGKVGIDQTTPGTTNRVFLPAAQPTVVSTAALAANASAAGTYFSGMGADGTFAYPFAYFVVSAFADQAGTLFVESSLDNSTFFPRNGSAGTAVAAGQTVDVKVPLTANVMRVRFVNGSTAQTKFFLSFNPSRS